MRRIFTFLIASSFVLSAKSQATLNESFTDGNFTLNPAWQGSTTRWSVVSNSDVSTGTTASNTLRLASDNNVSPVYLSTQLNDAWGNNQTWSFWIGRRQAATIANQSIFWLWANETNVLSATVDGYRIRFGDDDAGGDKVFLEKVTNGVAITVIASTGATTNGISDFGFTVKVTRNKNSLWTLNTSTLPTASSTGATADANPNLISTVSQGSASDNTYTNFDFGYTALMAVHGNGLNTSNAEFDNIQITSFSETVTPVNFTSFDAKKLTIGTQLSWKVGTEENVSRYEIERSNGSSYVAVGSVLASGQSSYSFTDPQGSQGTVLYRIKSVDNDGQYKYSTIISLKNGIASIILKAFPIPARNVLTVQHPIITENAQITIAAGDGRTVQSILPAKGSMQTDVKLDGLKTGIYLLRFSNGDGQLQTMKIIKQ